MISGLDASNVNGALNWPEAKRLHHLSFAFVKATEGTGFLDADFPASWQALAGLGLARGAYHFAHPSNSPVAEAEHFLGYVRQHGLHAGDVLALDLEDSDGLPPHAVAAYGQAWCAHVAAATGRDPLVYTFLSFAEAGNCAGLGGYPLWIADPSSAPGTPRVPAPWKGWAVHQYGQQGTDLDVANYPDAAAMIRALGQPDWQETIMNKLPVLQQGAADKAGQVFYVHRMQALAACFGRINNIAAAACVLENGTFDAATATAVKAVQASRKLAVDGICGPATWSVLLTGSA